MPESKIALGDRASALAVLREVARAMYAPLPLQTHIAPAAVVTGDRAQGQYTKAAIDKHQTDMVSDLSKALKSFQAQCDPRASLNNNVQQRNMLLISSLLRHMAVERAINDLQPAK